MHTSTMDHKVLYLHLAIMAVLSFVSMFVLMYAMVDSFADVYVNFNQFYMAGLMTMPMIVIELLVMGMVYHDKKLNIGILLVSVMLFILFWTGIRQQAGVGDEQFLRSMIPHHASAILMCEKAALQDPEIKELCRNILSSQQSQIGQMKNILNRLK